MALQNKGVILNIASDLSVIAPSQDLYAIKNVDDDKQPVKPITLNEFNFLDKPSCIFNPTNEASTDNDFIFS